MKDNYIKLLICIILLIISTCRKKNQPPYTPCPPSGPSIGVINKVYRFTSKAIDPNNDSIAIRFDWGDEDTSDWGELVESDEVLAMAHLWSIPDNYNVKVQAKDKYENYSKWSLSLIVEISENQPPIVSTPSGPLTGTINSLYQFSCLAIDPHREEVAIRFDWGDGDTSEWSKLVPSCSLVTMSHSWYSYGTYYIKTQATDKIGLTSEWSPEHQIIITSGGEPGTVKWRYQTGSLIESSPAIGSDGTIYVSSWDGYLYAINPDGTLKWCYQVGVDVISPSIGSDGTIYFVGVYGNLYAINSSGILKWSYPTHSYSISSPAIGSDGTIYIGSYNGYLYAINPNGTLKWQYQTSEYYLSSPTIGSDSTIYISSRGGFLYAIIPDSLLKWCHRISETVLSSPVIGSDGTIYVSSWDSCLYAVNTDSTLKWRYKTSGNISSSPVIGTDGTIYIGSGNYLYAIDFDGSMKWRFQVINLENTIISSPAISANGSIYFATLSDYGSIGYFYALDSYGNLDWRYMVGGSIRSSPAIGTDGTVYFGSDDHYFYAIYGSGPLANSPWPMFRHDLKHTGWVGGGKN